MDVDLVRRAQRGDEDAFAALVDATGDRLTGIARRILRDPSRADDAVQAALVAIWRNLPALRDPARFEAWSWRLTVNACREEVRRSSRWLPNIFGSPVEASGPDAADDLADRDELERAFRDLSVEHRAVVVLRYFLELTPDEIARTLGIPGGTARSRLHHALRRLRAAVEADARTIVGEAAE
jgi:RNA polymerase sigma-70 factor, ECF subfamily